MTAEILPVAPRRACRVPPCGRVAALACDMLLHATMRARLPFALLVCVGLMHVAAHARAQQAPRVVTLDQALAWARAHHPIFRAADARVAVAQAATAVPRAAWLPTVGATAQLFAGTANNSTASTIAGAYVDLPRIGGTRTRTDPASADWTPYPSTIVAVGARQEVFDFGRIAALSAAADAEVAVARESADDLRLATDLAVRETFYSVRAAHAVEQAADGAYERAVTHRDFASAQVTQGLKPRIELERAEADLARYDVGRLRAHAGVDAAQALLASALGILGGRVDVTSNDVPEAPLPTLEATLHAASSFDPRLRGAYARIRAQAAETHAIEAEALPDVGLTASLSGRAGGAPPSTGDQPPGIGFAPVVPNWNVGLTFDWPIFDGAVWARRDASRAAEGALREEASALHDTLALEVQNAWLDAQMAVSTLPALQRAAEAARANEAQADARFRGGLGTSVELADAEALRADAEIQLAVGQFEIARARAHLDRFFVEAP